MTVIVMSVLFALGFAFSRSSAINLRIARNARESVRRTAARDSALHYALSLLRSDAKGGKSDTLEDAWADDDLAVVVDGTRFALSIKDEDRKLNLNRAALPRKDAAPDMREALKRLVLAAGRKQRDFDLIRQWLDPSKVAHDVENAPRRPILFVSQLEEITGLDQRLLRGEIGKRKFADLVTAHARRININTAYKEVLDAVWDDDDVVQRLLRRREETPFSERSQIEAFLQSVKAPDSVKRTVKAFDVKSCFFLVTVVPEGAPGGLRALVRRRDDRVDVLYVSLF